MMLLGAFFQCLDPVLTIGAILSYRSPFVSVLQSSCRYETLTFYCDYTGKQKRIFKVQTLQ